MDQEQQAEVKEQLGMVVDWFEGEREQLGTVKFYQMLADKLSLLANKKPGWGWRYVQGVHVGSVGASEVFGRAVRALGASLDDAPVSTVYTVQVQVLARPGAVPAGTLVLGEARQCVWPGCRVRFVPRVPWQRYCDLRLHEAAEREKRKAPRK